MPVPALAAPAGWALAGGATEAAAGTGLLAAGGEAAAAAGTFLVSNPIGWGILAIAAVGTVGYLGYKAYQNAHAQSQAKSDTKTKTLACATCKENPCAALACGIPGSKLPRWRPWLYDWDGRNDGRWPRQPPYAGSLKIAAASSCRSRDSNGPGGPCPDRILPW